MNVSSSFRVTILGTTLEMMKWLMAIVQTRKEKRYDTVLESKTYLPFICRNSPHNITNDIANFHKTERALSTFYFSETSFIV